jgi:hypothetical protein
MKIGLKISVVVAGMFAVILSAIAGEDGKFYPASLCRTIYANQADQGYHSLGQFTNMSNKPLRVTCPIIRDQGLLKRVDVWVIDEHPTENINCTLMAVSSQKNTIDGEKEKASTNNKVSSPQELSFTKAKRLSKHHAVIECQIPPLWNEQRSRIINYFVVEDD